MLQNYETQGPISILECRSGWRVFMQTGWDDAGTEATGVNLAYSRDVGGNFLHMLYEAHDRLGKNLPGTLPQSKDDR